MTGLYFPIFIHLTIIGVLIFASIRMMKIDIRNNGTSNWFQRFGAVITIAGLFYAISSNYFSSLNRSIQDTKLQTLVYEREKVIWQFLSIQKNRQPPEIDENREKEIDDSRAEVNRLEELTGKLSAMEFYISLLLAIYGTIAWAYGDLIARKFSKMRSNND